MLEVQFSDAEIEYLIAMPKDLPANYRGSLRRMNQKSYSDGHEEAQLEVSSPTEGSFRIMLRRSRINPVDFSAILGYLPPERSKVFRLLRYNGASHEHTNKLEGSSFRTFHIHHATERYQRAGWDEDRYAAETDRYETLDGALEALLDDCNFIRPEQERLQPKLL